VNLTMGKSRPQESELKQEKVWDETDPHAKYNAVSDACWLYQDRELEQTLRRLDWRKARKRVLGRGAVGREWMERGRGENCVLGVGAWRCASPAVRVSWAGRSSKTSSGLGGPEFVLERDS
jgi:hypothetical protein